MAVLVIYYSASGNTRQVAEMLAARTAATLYEIKTVKPTPQTEFGVYVMGIPMMMKKQDPPLVEDFPCLDDYDTIFLGTPVWGSNMAASVRSFLHKCPIKGKRVALFACYKSAGGEQCFEALREALPGNEFIGQLGLTSQLMGDSDIRMGYVEEFLAENYFSQNT